MARRSFLAVLSAGLLVGSFPNFNFAYLIWIALIPFLFLLKETTPRSAFFWGWGIGYVFFLGTHYWLIHVTLPGMLLVNLYLAVYFAIFAWGAQLFLRFPPVGQLIFLPSLWVVCELGRDRIMTGFGWACLGHSQYAYLPIIQIADLTGVFGISFLIVFVNVVVYLGLKQWLANRTLKLVPFMSAVGLFVLVLGYGFGQIKQYSQVSGPQFNIGVVQPNIPQSEKWQGQSLEGIQKKILQLSLLLLERNAIPVQMLVWPETSVPGYMWVQPKYFQDVKAFAKKYGIPMLVGAVTYQEGYYNSALWLSQEGEVTGQYHKRHLVPFGEFLPLRPLLNFVENFVPIGDFNRGAENTVFPDGFSVLICFEDTVSDMVRGMTKAGARYLINISNDGWFKDTNEPYLHLQNAVFQSIANRRVMIRCGNTGISCKIDRAGQVTRFKNAQGKSVMVEGTDVFKIHQSEWGTNHTVYLIAGDCFAYVCMGIIFWGIIIRKKYCS